MQPKSKNGLEPKKRKGSPYWYVRGTINGREIFESTGIPHAGLKRPTKEIKDFAAKREAELKSTGRSTYGDAIAAYLEAGGSPRFIEPINEKLGKMNLSDINQQLIDKTALEIYPDCSAATRNRQFYTPFIAVWTHASVGQNAMCPPIKWGRPKGSTVLKQVRKPSIYEDAVKFINACPDHAAEIMFFLFWTGCRPIEAITLDCCNVDIKGRWAVLEGAKDQPPRGIPLHRSLIPMLKEKIKHGGKVFRSSKGKPYKVNKTHNKAGRIISQGGNGFSTAIRSAQKLGLGITPYTARHTVSNFLTREKLHDERDEILGHSKTVKSVYVHLPQADLIKAIDTLPDAGKLKCRIEIRAKSVQSNKQRKEKKGANSATSKT